MIGAFGKALLAVLFFPGQPVSSRDPPAVMSYCILLELRSLAYPAKTLCKLCCRYIELLLVLSCVNISYSTFNC